MKILLVALLSVLPGAAGAEVKDLQPWTWQSQSAQQHRLNARLETRIDNRLPTRIRDAASGTLITPQAGSAPSDHTHDGAGVGTRPR